MVQKTRVGTLSDLLAPYVPFDLCTAEQAAEVWTRRAQEMGSPREYSRKSVYTAVRRGSLVPAVQLFQHPLFLVRDVEEAHIVPSSGHPRAADLPLPERLKLLRTVHADRVDMLRAALPDEKIAGDAREELERTLEHEEHILVLITRYQGVVARKRYGSERSALRRELIERGVLDR